MCPVRKAIEDLYKRDAVIRGGGKGRDVLARQTSNEQEGAAVNSGEAEYGATSTPRLSVSYGDMPFLTACKKMDLARFKVSRPTLSKCLERFTVPAPEFAEYYKQVAMSASKPMFTALFVRAYDLAKGKLLAKKATGEIPPPIFVFDIRALCLVPAVLTRAVNWIVGAINSADGKKIEELPAFTEKFPSGSFPEIPDALDVESALAYLDRYQEAEFTVLEYAARVEVYQAAAYAKLEEILSSA